MAMVVLSVEREREIGENRTCDNGVARVDFHCLWRIHVLGLGGVRKCLGTHDTLHVGAVAVLRSDENARCRLNTGRHHHFGHLGVVKLLEESG